MSMAMRVSATLTLVGLGAITVVAWLLVGSEDGNGRTASPVADGGFPAIRADEDAGREQPESPTSELVAAPTAEDVIANPDCRMAVEQGSVPGVALVVVPTADGAWYAVVGQDGVRLDGTLPFQPDRYAFGAREDGTVIAGFGRDGNVRIFHDGQSIYELDDAWDFDIADNGSSFYAIEPLTGAARLVVRNIDLGEEHHYELDDSLVPTGAARNFGTSYSVDFSEVIVSSIRGGVLSFGARVRDSAAAAGLEFSVAPMASTGVQRFFRVDGGPMRTVTAETAKRGVFFPPESVLLASSETGYDVSFEDGRGWRIAKVNREYGSGGRVSRTAEVWSTDIASRLGPWLPPILSKDGAWLAVWGSQFEILDTTTGMPVRRLSEDEDGEEGIGFEFRGDRLLVYRREGEYVAVHAMVLNGEDDSGIRIAGRLRNEPVIPELVGGILNDYSLEFDWDRTPGPSLRLAVCSEDVPLFGALRVRDGQVTFEPSSGSELQ